MREPIDGFATRREEWKLLPDWSAYEVSSLGRVRRCLPGNGTWVGRVLRPNRHRQGYLLYRLMQDGLQRDVLGHILVAEAFLGGTPMGMECNHVNGVKDDNRIENIEVITHSQNMRHADRNGLRDPHKPNLKNRGSSNGMARLTETDVALIKRALSRNEHVAQIALQFGVAVHCISKIRNGTRWSHVNAVQED